MNKAGFYIKRIVPCLILMFSLNPFLLSQKVRKHQDVEACMMAERLRLAKTTAVSIRTFTIQGDDVWNRVGSGWIYNPEGLIVTRQSVIQGGDSIEVTFFNGRTEPAWVLDCDPISQIALLKTRIKKHPAAKAGSARRLEPGDCVILLGNSLGVFPSVTMGHMIDFQPNDIFLIDGSVPAGNSGGPLFDCEGRVVGMLAGRKQWSGHDGFVGVGIPMETIQAVLDRFFSFVNKDIGWMGLYVADMPAAGSGVRVVSVIPDGPADRASISPGDTLVTLNGEPIRNTEQLAEKVSGIAPQNQVTFEILKNSVAVPCVVRIGKVPIHK
ncbi:serine protease [bacterium]|nr:serine protease [bacterium]